MLYAVIATELHHFMLYYMLPVLLPYMPCNHYHHFAILVTAIRTLLSAPTIEEIHVAGLFLECFIRENSNLYGKLHNPIIILLLLLTVSILSVESADTINVHGLCHLEHQVRDFGPLWANSMFPFENMVKEVGGLFTGTRGIPDQVSLIYNP